MICGVFRYRGVAPFGPESCGPQGPIGVTKTTEAKITTPTDCHRRFEYRVARTADSAPDRLFVDRFAGLEPDQAERLLFFFSAANDTERLNGSAHTCTTIRAPYWSRSQASAVQSLPSSQDATSH